MEEKHSGSHAVERILRITKELRELSSIYSIEIKVETLLKPNRGNVVTASETYIRGDGKKYRHNHYFDGREDLTDGRFRTVHPEDIELKARYIGCDEDCFNCLYPDCKKPETGMKSI